MGEMINAYKILVINPEMEVPEKIWVKMGV
jgi:hypothetical protein